MHEYVVGVKKLSGISRKLSLDASGSNTVQSDVGMNVVRSNASPGHDRHQVITDSCMVCMYCYICVQPDNFNPLGN